MMLQTDKAGADKIIRKAVTNTKMYLGNAVPDPGFGPQNYMIYNKRPHMMALKRINGDSIMHSHYLD